MVMWFLCPGASEGSTGSGSDFKASKKTGPRLKVSSDRLGEPGLLNTRQVTYLFFYYYCCFIIGPRREKTCLRGGGEVSNNKGADKPALPRSLISTFVISLIEKYNT